jgi:anti-sigma factor RsiW
MTVCSGTLEHVELALLEGSELSSAVQAHLTSCSACSAETTALRAIVSALQVGPAPVAPAGLTARIVPLVLAEAEKGRRQGVFARALRPLTAAATSFILVAGVVAVAGIGLVVGTNLTAGSRTATPSPEAPATEAPATVKTPSTEAPATEAPATEVPAAPATPAPTPTPTPELPRRTPEPVSPDPSEGESTAPTEGTSP